METPEKTESPVAEGGASNNDSPLDTSPQSDNSSSITIAGLADTHAEVHAEFDPAIHAVNADGTPKRKADGSLALKRGRKAGGAAASALPPKFAAAQTVVGEQDKRLSLDQAARESANLVINVSVWTLGAEVGQPIDKAEAEGLRLSFRNYYEARGVPDLPPEIGLFIALGSYIGPRLMHEKSQSKMEKLGAWVKSKTGR
jgi:hypothetical protein